MGYSYEMSYDGRQRLCCDNCGNAGGVRKRPCRYQVTSSSLSGPRYTMQHCPAPAVCGPCYKKLGGMKIHDGCKTGAEASQAKYDAEQARLDAGDAGVVTRWGSWADGVPEGHYKAVFQDVNGVKTELILPDSDSQPNWLSECSGSVVS